MTSLFPRRFACVEHPQDNSYHLVDKGDVLSPRPDGPETWAVFLYSGEDRKSKALAAGRCRFIAGILNGVREPSEVIDVL